MPQSTPELIIVMPVYNEEASIRRVVEDWLAEASRSAGSFVILAIDDGSSDGTLEILEELRGRSGESLEIISRENRGHGQSCMQGYRVALERNIPFILQVDSDGQSDPGYFQEFWRQRGQFDVIYGKRTRSDGARRIVASFILRWSLRLLAGVDCVDANVPYRLMNTSACSAEIRSIPASISLANIALAVGLKRNPNIRHSCIGIEFPPRHGGEASVPFSKFAFKAVELFRQLGTLHID